MPVILDHRAGVAILTIEQAPVNALGAALRVALRDALQAACADPAVAAVVVTGAGRCFSAGADIGDFQRSADAGLSSGCDLNDLSALCDAASKPVVAAVHGYAFGGGLEIALGMHARVAARRALIGLPEIKLGVLPGAGGTQRLTRLIGLEAAAAMILSGEPVTAERAAAFGLVDVVVPDDGDLLDAAAAEALRRVGRPPRRARDLHLPALDAATRAMLQQARERMPQPRAHGHAADRILACFEAAAALPFDDGMAFERAAFLACNASSQGAALQHVFFAQREAAKLPGLPRGTADRLLRTAGVVGAGAMGRGIAVALARAGLAVRLCDVDAATARAAVGRIADELQRRSASGRAGAAASTAIADAVTAADGLDALADCDLVVEAVIEDLAVKREVLSRLGALCRADAVLATNTSTLDIDTLAEASGRPADVVGLHFFNPAPVMRLLEVVPGRRTAPDVVATAMALARRMDKVAVVVAAPSEGFIGNRMLAPYLAAAERLLLQGVDPARIDGALEAFGMAMGPCRTMDLAGLDVIARIAAERASPDPLDRIVARTLAADGRHGQKTGAGIYRYDGRTALDDPAARATIAALAERLGIAAIDAPADDEIVHRCLRPLVDAGRAIVREGVALRASDVDMVWVFGYGFPAERGGPLFWAGRQAAQPWPAGATPPV